MSGVARMSPQHLADAGIPVEVALRARIDESELHAAEAIADQAFGTWSMFRGETQAYRDALAIIEAKR